MAKWIIDKVVGEFDYGHNVWTQDLDETLSCGSQCKCKWRHGHRGKVIAYLEADTLTGASDNMVIDFNDLKIMSQWIDKTLDHKYIVDINDPANFDTFSHFWKDGKFIDNALVKQYEGNWIINPEMYSDMDEIIRTKYESYVIVPFVPTSEQLSRWIYEIMTSFLYSNSDIKVNKIEWYETPKSRATYYGD